MKWPEEKQTTAEKQNSLSIEETQIKELFTGCDDVKFQPFTFPVDDRQWRVMFTYCQGLYDPDRLQKNVIVQLEKFFRFLESKHVENSVDIVEKELLIPSIQLVTNLSEIPTKVFSGEVLMYFNDLKAAFSVDISNLPQRSPQDPNSEISILGARDGFIEELSVNTALIRKRFRTNTLHIKEFILGERTKTRVGLLYIKDVTNPDFISEVEKKLRSIKIDGIHSSNQLKELLWDSPFTIFPIFNYTGRPDFVVDSLLRGRFAIIVDGSPTAIVGPGNVLLLLRSAEDQDSIWVYNSFERLMRIVGLFVATFLPGFWVAIISFHPEQLPLSLLYILVASRKGVPLPSAAEAILMLMLFELFREAGYKLPASIGQTLSVVGGLIIGDAAIRAGLTNPAMLVIISTSFVATYTLVNQALAGTISVLRFFVLIFCSFLGLWGLAIAGYLIFLYMANLRPFGVPYLAPVSWKSVVDMFNIYIRLPWNKYTGRPKMLGPQDPTRKGGTA
jgi:spore germination protein KA